MKSWILAGAAIAAVMYSFVASISPVFAEPPIGSRLGNRVDAKPVEDDRDAVQAAHQLAGCIVVKRGSSARSFLDSRDLADVKKIASQMGGEVDCIANIERNDLVEGIRVNYPEDIMRGDIAEELLKRNQSAVQLLQPLPIEKTYARPWFAFTGRNVSVYEMAACVSSTNPAGIMALVRTEPFSGEENAALGNLIPAMGPCLVAGAKLDAKREPLRAALADALYQRIANPSEGDAKPAKTVSSKPRK